MKMCNERYKIGYDDQMTILRGGKLELIELDSQIKKFRQTENISL